jgi:hypothetical protein
LGPTFARGKTSTPVWVDSTGKQLGPQGFSDSIAQGVVLQVAPFPNFSIWLLVPFGVEGTGYATYVSPTYGPGMLGDQQFFTTTNCQGTAYALSPSPRQLARNSERHPYPESDQAQGSRNEARDRCPFLPMFRHGFRVSEARRLNFDQMDAESSVLHVARLKARSIDHASSARRRTQGDWRMAQTTRPG